MCGIVGVVNGNQVASDLIGGLRQLEYWGYDSAGLATIQKREIECRRAKGKLDNLEALLTGDPIDGKIGIAHTCWATHGAPTVSVVTRDLPAGVLAGGVPARVIRELPSECLKLAV